MLSRHDALPISHADAVRDFIVESDTGIEHVGAATVGQIDRAADDVGRDPRVAPGQRATAGIETWVSGDFSVGRNDWDRQQPLALVVEVARIDLDRAPVPELMADIGGDQTGKAA